MRIRKTISKLVGSAAIVYPSFSSPLLVDAWVRPTQSDELLRGYDSAVEASVEICRVNQSPWDAAYPNLDQFFRSSQDLETSPSLKEEKQEVALEVISVETKGILENSVVKDVIENKPPRVCKRLHSSIIEKKKITKKTDKNETKKRKKKTEVTLCKKNDGRKWFCKRPAQPHHSFCAYHATQSRSYYNAFKKVKIDDDEMDQHTDTTSNMYVYYDGFGPSRGKKRSFNADVKREEEGDDSKATGEKATGEKKVGKKRGRKPMKCRSLKSLL